MNSFCNRFRTVFILSLIISFSSGNIFAQLVTNGGFENSDPGIVEQIDGWSILVTDDIEPAPVFEVVTDNVEEGNQALKVLVETLGANSYDIQLVADSIAVEPGETYQYSIWAKAEKSGAQVNFTVGNYSYQEYAVIRPATLTTEWKEYTMEFTIDDAETFARAPIHFSLSAAKDVAIYLDDLTIISNNFGKKPIVVEAEFGEVGSNFSIKTNGDVEYVTTNVNFEGLETPENENSIVTCEIAFEDSGYYNLFVRMRVGSGNFNDDSFFPARGFGNKDVTLGADWQLVNGLAGAGFTDPNEYVDDLGTAGSSVWKWVNVSKNSFPYNAMKDSFYVSPDSLTKTFQFGSREDGLDIDKIAFGKSNLFYTVDALDNVSPGSVTKEEDSTYVYGGPSLAEGLPKFLGSVKDINDDNFANYWNQLTPGNEGKWGSIAGASQDTAQWNWSGLEALYNYAQENDLIFKNHTLIWGNQQPGWISSLDSAEQYESIETWICMVGKRFPDMDMVDVVNEPLSNHNPPDGQDGRANYMNALGGRGETGWDWVIKAFELARKYIPNAKLLINDYGIINDNGATNSYLYVINLLKDRGLIDGIGVQGHRFEFERALTSTLTSNLDKLAATGLPIYISEMDLGNYDDSGTPNDQTQLNLYKKIFPVIWQHPGVKGVTLWGYKEGKMWQPTCFLVRKDGTWRPAIEWLADYVQNNPTGVELTDNEIPTEFILEQNYPNPFNPTTTIRYSIPVSGKVSLKVFDILGSEVANLVNGEKAAGNYSVNWDASKLASGIYVYRIQTGSFVQAKKLVLIK